MNSDGCDLLGVVESPIARRCALGSLEVSARRHGLAQVDPGNWPSGDDLRAAFATLQPVCFAAFFD